MGSVKFQLSQTIFHQKPQTHKPRLRFSSILPCGPKPTIITCGLRGGPRKSLWRSRVLSTEAIQVVQSLKLAKSSTKLEEVFSSRLSRLLKADLLDTLAELQRQNELELTLKVFEFVRKEVWYKPDLSLYCEMILMVGKKKLIEMAEDLFSELKKEGLKPDTRAYTEMIGAYLQVGMIENAMKTYDLMKSSGCAPDELTLTILIRNLESAGEKELATSVKKECAEYVDSPEKFLEEVGRNQRGGHSILFEAFWHLDIKWRVFSLWRILAAKWQQTLPIKLVLGLVDTLIKGRGIWRRYKIRFNNIFT